MKEGGRGKVRREGRKGKKEEWRKGTEGGRGEKKKRNLCQFVILIFSVLHVTSWYSFKTFHHP